MEENAYYDYDYAYGYDYAYDEYSSFGNRTEETMEIEKPATRAAFIIAYTIVFCCCFFGNLLVILVVLGHKKMRTITNFFLANLAFADMCVGIFCVYPNMYLMFWFVWPLGDAMCRIYMFIHGTSYTASIWILVVISIERYLAITKPMKCRQWLTKGRLVIVTVVLWVVAICNNVPKLILYGSQKIMEDVFLCIMKPETMSKTRMQRYVLASFIVWYIIPLCVISLIYTKISITLWRSTTSQAVNVEMRNLNKQRNALEKAKAENAKNSRPEESVEVEPDSSSRLVLYSSNIKSSGGLTNSNSLQSQISNEGRPLKPKSKLNVKLPSIKSWSWKKHPSQAASKNSKRKEDTVMEARKKVVRLLIVVILIFAVCVLPYHIRVLIMSFSSSYDSHSSRAMFVERITYLILYMNSGLNPLLYAFLSEKFRTSMKQILCCNRDSQERVKSTAMTVTSNVNQPQSTI